MAAVSTHSRPKAAGAAEAFYAHDLALLFQLTAARRRLGPQPKIFHVVGRVSTHSRPKAAGWFFDNHNMRPKSVSTHSRPKAAGRYSKCPLVSDNVSTHSRPKAAGFFGCISHLFNFCFNSQPPEGGWTAGVSNDIKQLVSTHSRPKAAGSLSWFLRT